MYTKIPARTKSLRYIVFSVEEMKEALLHEPVLAEGAGSLPSVLPVGVLIDGSFDQVPSQTCLHFRRAQAHTLSSQSAFTPTSGEGLLGVPDKTLKVVLGVYSGSGSN